jgi:hypothetical protein
MAVALPHPHIRHTPPGHGQVDVVDSPHVYARTLKLTVAFNYPIYILPDLTSDILPESGKMYGVESGKMSTCFYGG